MTSPRCSICGRPDRAAIDEALAGGRTLRVLAKKFGTSDSTLDRHRQHMSNARRTTRTPSPRATRSAEIAAPPMRSAPMTTDQLISELEAVVQRQLLRVADDNDLEEGERAKIQSAAIAGLVHLAKLQGRTELSERRILAAPAMRRIQDRMIEVLAKWPDALAAVGQALLELGAERGS